MVALEWLAFLGLTAVGAAITYAEWRLGLLDWIGDSVPERHPLARETIYVLYAVAQGLLVGAVGAWRWPLRRRVLIATSIALALVLTALEFDAGWHGWTLPAPGTKGKGTWVLVGLAISSNFLVSLAVVALARAAVERRRRR